MALLSDSGKLLMINTYIGALYREVVLCCKNPWKPYSEKLLRTHIKLNECFILGG